MPALRRAVLVRETAERSDGELLAAFVSNRDADAFAVLVRRHGPMVLGVCRRVVGDVHAADDAFQAVFLVLARRASAVRPRARVGNWLYGVAYRTAMKARAVLARRRSREKQVDAMPEPTVSPATDSWADLHPVIDEELARLPEKLRLPVVLCDLEGRPQRSVARHLGVAPATLATRLASARRLLAQRLGRRGIALSGGALGTLLAERASAASIAPTLADGVVRAAEAIATGTAATGLVSAQALQLCEGVMRMMLMTKLKAAGVCALAALVISGGLGFGLAPASAGDDPAPAVTVRLVAQPAADKPAVDDATFLRRIFIDLTGLVPTRLEMSLFLADRDPNKRAKVVDWLIADEQVKAAVAKRFKVKPEQVTLERMAGSNSRSVRVTIALDGTQTLDQVSNVLIDANIARLDRSAVLNLYDVKGTVEIVSDRAVLGAWLNAQQLFTNGTSSAWLDRTLTAGGNESRPHVRIWSIADGKRQHWLTVRPNAAAVELNEFYDEIVLSARVADPDEAFLDRVMQSARGNKPTPLEHKYFAEDKDPKKREKILELMLTDPAIAKKVGDDWKKKMLEKPTANGFWNLRIMPLSDQQVAPQSDARLRWYADSYNLIVPLHQPDRFDKLVAELLAAQKSDEQILEAITLAAAGRLTTAEEKRVTLAIIGTAADKKSAWAALARSLVASPEESKTQTRPAVPRAK